MADKKKAAAKSDLVEVTITDAPGTAPIVVRVNDQPTTFKIGEPQKVSEAVLEALSRVSGITYEESKA